MNNYQPPAKWTQIEIRHTDEYEYVVYKSPVCEYEILIPFSLVEQLQSEAIKKWLEESGTQELLFKQNKQARADERKKPSEDIIKSKLKSLWHRSLPLEPLTLEIGNLQWAWIGDTIQGEPAENLPFTATLLDCNQQEFETEEEAKAWCEEKLVELIEEIYPIFSLFKEQGEQVKKE